MIHSPTTDELRHAFAGMHRSHRAGLTFDDAMADALMRLCLINCARAIRRKLEEQAGHKLPHQAELLPC